MVTQVKAYVRDCRVCKETKSTNCGPKPGIGAEVKSYRPFQKIYIGFLGKYPRSRGGHAYVLVVVDHFSKFVFLQAMREATANGAVKFLKREVFHKFGVPERVHSVNGKQFVSKQFEQLLREYGVKHLRTALYSPQSNAAERVNQSVLNAIRSYLNEDHRDWDLYLSEIEFKVRDSIAQGGGLKWGSDSCRGLELEMRSFMKRTGDAFKTLSAGVHKLQEELLAMEVQFRSSKLLIESPTRKRARFQGASLSPSAHLSLPVPAFDIDPMSPNAQQLISFRSPALAEIKYMKKH
ncbi:uncharacterized protein LOC124460969 [Drosophila willistoni]|uniref:uncharacterized protein LOC124460969 n=1 Tax=Drosophila willistoni TaxID=7260 RepID=UPI001F085C94|nr:uncharacterized protein LOC124460969 [Drosophila willistoni]